MTQPILKVEAAGKNYDGTWVLRDVDFEARAREVHGLVGENGAGKSTLSKAIAGALRLSSGAIRLDGVVRDFHAPIDALRQGIAIVYQETSLVPTLTVAQNVHLGRERRFFSQR